MKIRAFFWATLGIILAGFAAIASQNAIADGEQQGIPLPTGPYSSTLQGSLAICLNPRTFTEESCSTSGVLVVPLSVLDNGAITEDTQGNNCATLTEVDSNLPVDASPPTVTPNEHVVGKVLDYDSATGTGDGSFTTYIGGTCNGATFDSTGATQISSGTDHFVVTDRGKRIDFILSAPRDRQGLDGESPLR
jgi:hypothetical protein